MNFLRENSAAFAVPALILALAVMGTRWTPSGSPMAPGTKAPDFELAVEAGPGEGEAFHLAAAAGRPVVLEFWAGWCPPCKQSVPVLNGLAAELGDRAQVVAVHVDDSPPATVREEHARFGWQVPTVSDRDGSLQRAYGVRSLPTLVVIGPDQRVTHVHQGVPQAAAMRATLASIH